MSSQLSNKLFSFTGICYLSIIVITIMLLVQQPLPLANATRGDEKNLTRLLNNQVLVSKQIMCVLEKSPCDQLGRQLKGKIPEAVATNCEHCTQAQLDLIIQCLNSIATRKPDELAQLIYKYDPNAALPEVILRNCRNCSPQQAQNAQKLTNFLQTRYPDVWAMLIRKYRGV